MESLSSLNLKPSIGKKGKKKEIFPESIGAVTYAVEEERHVEQVLVPYERLFRAVAMSATDAIISVDDAGKIIFWNDAAEKMFGYGRTEAEVMPLTAIVPDRFREAHSSGLTRVVQTGVTRQIGKTIEATAMRKDGKEFPIELSLSMWHAGGERVFFTGIVRDITERKGTEEELKKAKEELKLRIAERTEELRRVNETLTSELAERKRTEETLERTLRGLKRALEGTVTALATTTEKKDAYTAGHQRRVARLACAIAEEIGLSKEFIEGLNTAGLLHDIGKIAVPAEILSKPGKLYDYEFALIKPHPQIGYEILKDIEFPRPVALSVLQHHERMDGSGYPNGLSGDDIIMEARILAVADVVEAMSTHRPYRPALGVEAALQEIERRSGVAYDTLVVKACLKVLYGGVFSLD